MIREGGREDVKVRDEADGGWWPHGIINDTMATTVGVTSILAILIHPTYALSYRMPLLAQCGFACGRCLLVLTLTNHAACMELLMLEESQSTTEGLNGSRLMHVSAWALLALIPTTWYACMPLTHIFLCLRRLAAPRSIVGSVLFWSCNTPSPLKVVLVL